MIGAQETETENNKLTTGKSDKNLVNTQINKMTGLRQYTPDMLIILDIQLNSRGFRPCDFSFLATYKRSCWNFNQLGLPLSRIVLYKYSPELAQTLYYSFATTHIYRPPHGQMSRFSNRLIQPRCLKEWKSFLPGAIKLYNASQQHPHNSHK